MDLFSFAGSPPRWIDTQKQTKGAYGENLGTAIRVGHAALWPMHRIGASPYQMTRERLALYLARKAPPRRCPPLAPARHWGKPLTGLTGSAAFTWGDTHPGRSRAHREKGPPVDPCPGQAGGRAGRRH